MRKMIYICDKCFKPIENESPRYISIQEIDEDGDLAGENPLEECQFCSKCVGAILEAITQRPTPKKRGRKPKGIYTKNAKAMLSKE